MRRRSAKQPHLDTKQNWKMVLLPTKSPNDNDEREKTHQLNSRAIDTTYTNTLNNTANCQPENDVENLGLLQTNNNGKTISINFKQTKMHHNATTLNLSRQQCDNGHFVKSNQTASSAEYLQQFYIGQFITTATSNIATISRRHLNKMQLIAIILSYLLAFSIQSATARPNVDRNYDSTSNWQSVALTSENEVS